MFYAAMLAGNFASLLIFLTGGLPLGVPPVEDPTMMKVAPPECLVYVSWAGMGEADPASKNSTEAMMASAEVQRIFAEVDKRLSTALLAIPDDEANRLTKEGVPLGRLLLTRPAAFFLESVAEGEAGVEYRGGALVNLGPDAAKVQASIERLQQQYLKEAVTKVELGGMPGHQIKFGPGVPEFFWAIQGEYLYVGVGAGSVEAIAKRTTGEAPAWLTALRKSSGLERVSSIIHFDVARTTETALPLAGDGAEFTKSMLAGFGFDNVKTIDFVSGLDAKGFISQTKFSLADEAKGILKLASDESLSPLDLETIPADSTLAVAVRADAMQWFRTFGEIGGGFDPTAPDEMERGLRQVEEQSGVKIIDGIFKGLGDVWCAYNSPSEGGLIFTGLTATVTVRDYDLLKPELEKVRKIMSDEFERTRGFRDGRGPQFKEMEFAGETIYYITGQDDFAFIPSFCLTKDHLIFSLFPQNIQAMLSRGKDFQSLATSPHVGPHMKMSGGPSVIVYQDTRELFKMLYPMLPLFSSMMSREMNSDVEFDHALLPSVKAIAPYLNPGLMTIARTNDALVIESRNTLPGGVWGAATPVIVGAYAPSLANMATSAQRVQSTNNLKQLGLALHNYHDENLHFPQAFTATKDGAPLLSWRVAILPYIGEGELYKEFHLDEPWDSEHNRKLLARMPAVFRAPNSKEDDFKTVYLAPRMAGGVLSGEKVGAEIERVTIADVTDGTSNTIMLVEAGPAAAVEWTKPDDFKVDLTEPTAGLFGQHKQGFVAALADGSVQMYSRRIDASTLRNMFNRGDDEFVDHWRYQVGGGGGSAFGAGEVAVPRRVERFEAEVEEEAFEEEAAPDVEVEEEPFPPEEEPAVP